MSSKQAPRTQKYLRACADFVDCIRSAQELSETGLVHWDKYDERILPDCEAIDAFLAKAQEQS